MEKPFNISHLIANFDFDIGGHVDHVIICHNDAILSDDETASLADRLSLAINGYDNNDSGAILSVDLISITQAY